MTPSDFSVLLLAWDAADSAVTVLGGAALPPTRQLVQQLAAAQPVLAVYPHLPAEYQTAPAPAASEPAPPPASEAPAEPTPTATIPSASADTLAAAGGPPTNPAGPPAVPGVRLLPPPAPANEQSTAPKTPPSRIVGLDDLMPATPPAATLGSGPMSFRRTPAVRSQWPGGIAPTRSGRWLAPAAPYVGASTGAARQWRPGPYLPPPPAPAGVPARPVAASPRATRAGFPPAALRPSMPPLAGDLRFDPDPELPIVRRPDVFNEPVEEVGAAEALDATAPEDDLTLAATAPAELALLVPTPAPPTDVPNAPTEALREATAPLSVSALPAVPTTQSLNARMIQYARRAAQLMQGRADFGVIYAPNWPTWLAALEIRNSSGRPLVLYAAGLAADFVSPVERGWLLEVERMALRRAHLVLVPHDALRQQLLAQYGTILNEVRVVAADDEATVLQVLRDVARHGPPLPPAAV